MRQRIGGLILIKTNMRRIRSMYEFASIFLCVAPACLRQPQNVYAMSRYRNVTTCARVHSPSGLNVVGVLPVVTPVSSAQRTALA